MKKIKEELSNYYNNTLQSYRVGPRSVGWKNEEAQKKRFAQLITLIEEQCGFSINDLGCGTGDLYDFLSSSRYENYSYRGYDVLEKMIFTASERHHNQKNVFFTLVKGAKDLKPADYTVSSGIFNLKYGLQEYEWINYILETIHFMSVNSHKGFAFNMLTKYSDKEYMQDHLYYADPMFFFDYCKRIYSRNVALLHHYDEYDFTIIVKK